jgi:Fur family transcriptional regulator, stress-responsive regulator
MLPGMRAPDELTQRFRERGLKVTPQRQAVFRALHGDPTHPTAEAVHARVVAEMPAVSLRTVYQTLNDLAGMGELLHLHLGTGSARFDPSVEQRHHHAVCDVCGSVRDLFADLDEGPVLGQLPGGFRATGTEVVVRGTCGDCSSG